MNTTIKHGAAEYSNLSKYQNILKRRSSMNYSKAKIERIAYVEGTGFSV